MEELKRRILSDAVVGESDIIHVDMFLNHCMDMELMEKMGNELAHRFKGERITKVLTAESSGIALACFVARALDVPAVYAKNFRPAISTRRSIPRRRIRFPWRSLTPCGYQKNIWIKMMWCCW